MGLGTISVQAEFERNQISETRRKQNESISNRRERVLYTI